ARRTSAAARGCAPYTDARGFPTPPRERHRGSRPCSRGRNRTRTRTRPTRLRTPTAGPTLPAAAGGCGSLTKERAPGQEPSRDADDRGNGLVPDARGRHAVPARSLPGTRRAERARGEADARGGVAAAVTPVRDRAEV